MYLEEVSYLVYGCLASIATSSMISLLAKGKTIEEALDIKEQDIVLFNNDQTVQIVKVNNEEFLIIKDSDILAIVEN